jgi:hypothetical protein
MASTLIDVADLLDFANHADSLTSSAGTLEKARMTTKALIDVAMYTPAADDGSLICVNGVGHGFTIKCIGALDGTGGEELRKSLEKRLARDPLFVYVDRCSLESLTSVGKKALFCSARRCRRAGVTHHLSINVYGPSLIHHSDSSNPEDPSTEAVSGILGRAAS